MKAMILASFVLLLVAEPRAHALPSAPALVDNCVTAAPWSVYSGEINSITYNASGEASKFVVGGPPPKTLEVGSPNEKLTKLLQRLLDNDTKVVVVDDNANDKFDENDTITEEG